MGDLFSKKEFYKMDMAIVFVMVILLGYNFNDYYQHYQIEKYSSRFLELEHVTQRYLGSIRKHPLNMNYHYTFYTKDKFAHDLNQDNQERVFGEFLYKNKDELNDIVDSVRYNSSLVYYYEEELKNLLSAIPPHPKYENKELMMLGSYYEKVVFNKPFTVYFIFSYTSPKGLNPYENSMALSAADVAEHLRQLEDDHTEKTEYELFRDTERSKMTAGLRYDILKRDQFMCQFCGVDASTHGVTLHVDHIEPVANWGKTEESNLQTLCRDCQLEKGTKE